MAAGESSTATLHGVTQYAAEYPGRRSGIGLALSGGGFRAALFHLGALQRLNELGLLGQLRTVTSVSGGSIVAAHLALAMGVDGHGGGRGLRLGCFADWRRQVAEPFLRFTGTDIRTGPLLAGWLLPWNWFRASANTDLLAAAYDRALTHGRNLEALPAQPRFLFLATDTAFGVGWTFERERLGDDQAGYAVPAPPNRRLSWAVAASSCFPPLFSPLAARVAPGDLRGGRAPAGPARDAAIRGLRLIDGGIYDNLGLEPIWRDHAVVLSSDGGSLLGWGPDRDNLFWRIERDVAIITNQVNSLRKRWLISNFLTGGLTGAYWGIGSAPSSYDIAGGYSKRLAVEVIAAIRTDLDAFSPAEAAVLQNHGYLLADAALRRHAPALLPAQIPSPPPPYPEWMDEDRVRAALAGSGRRYLIGRRGTQSQYGRVAAAAAP